MKTIVWKPCSTLIRDHLVRNHCRCNVMYSKDRYLDILPYRASKGKTVHCLSDQWQIPLANFLVCGDSGSDASMLRDEPPTLDLYLRSVA
ncbi:HAD family hydrolase [Desulfosarcina variabilis]|uniref:HAD family hydrolase n=1 Tax=Desulfosarcina variabilis TaxID=2300 RepID=UPI003AFAD56A